MHKSWLPALLIFFYCSLPATASELSVFAASSLTDALAEIVLAYEKQYPDEKVLLNFAGSQTLAMQIEQGAPVDLFISANQAVIDRLQNKGLVTDVQPLLGNRLALAKRADLQGQLNSIDDLARPELLLAIGNPQVPIGRYTRQLFDGLTADATYGAELVARIKQNIVSEENRVKAIIAKLLLGEADAGIVYRSDLSGSKLVAVPLPEQHNPLANYPIAKAKGRTDHSKRFYVFLLSNEAAEIFRRYGFMTGRDL